MVSIHKLSDVKIRGALKPGRHSDGGGLYLEVAASGSRSWLYMWKVAGKRRALGLGGYPAVALIMARKAAADLRSSIAQGIDPSALRKKSASPTFAECTGMFLEINRPAWRNKKHGEQWKMTLGEAYCGQILGKSVDQITTEDVQKILEPIWQAKAETASRIQGRIARVLDFARVKGWRTDQNPALWNGHLKYLLPPRKKLQRGHHPAMPYKQLPAFIAELETRPAVAALALRFLILTAARSGEVYGAQWSEINFENALWTLPPTRMKAGKAHVVPIGSAALAILKQLHATRVGEYVFPGLRSNRPLSTSAMEMLMRRMKQSAYTVHGFRSSFRDWGGDETTFARDVIETALAHRVGDETERAYRRNSAIAKRRELMADWENYLSP